MSTQKRPCVSPAVLSPSNRRRGLRALALSLAALATGCGAGGEGQASLDSSEKVSPQSLASLPARCQDILAANPQAPDGDYTLYVGGDAAMPWTAWCQNMAGTPSEYLTLARTGPADNFSQYTAGGPSPGTTVRTAYTRLRIDPTTLRVNTGDQTFSTSVGSLMHGSTQVLSMPYGVAMSCNGGLSPAHLDLRDTPFAVAVNQFALGGWNATGSTVYSDANQVVSLSGGGFCGWDAPVGSFNPFNQNGAQLQLQYRAPSRYATCQDLKTANPQAPDGEYTLYVGGDALKPWLAWCHDMAGTPSEYLTLVPTATASNYSQYTAGGNSPGTNVRTTYARLRLDPVTLRVNTADQTFASSVGSLLHVNKEPVKSMPYAAAMGCSRWGVGNVDLRGTPFAVATGQFMIGGVSTGGSSYGYSAANQVVSLSAYGGCGWVGPLNSYNPFNQNGQPLLLVYSGAQ
jgi:hypothetical protein